MLYSSLVEIEAEVEVSLGHCTTIPGGWVGGWVIKNEINAILNSS